MEVQLQELIEQIKKEGVDAAQTEARTILDAAKAEAAKIVENARVEADKILAAAKAETEKMTRSGEDAIRQACRNLLISFRESVTRELNALLKAGVVSVYSSEALARLVIHTVEAWASKPDADSLTVVLNSDTLRTLEETLLAGIKEKMLAGVTLKANDNFDGGFRIAANDGGAYYDYSAEAVADMLSGYLSPRLAALLKEAE